MAPTPSPRPAHGHQTPLKTPPSKHRLHFPNPKNNAHPSPCPLSAIKEAVPTEHPVEVIGRVRDFPDRKEKPASALEIPQGGHSIRVRTDIGYRDFSLDGVSVSEDEDLEAFYRRFVEKRIEGVRLGAKCTIMMYGPTGAGKSHTMFGCSKEPGIVYRALKDILGEGDREAGVDDAGFGLGLFVQVAVLEIYNEEIYDLLSGNMNAGGVSMGPPKGNTTKVRLEVMGKKAKNATYISGNEAGKISREVAKVEKRRIVKSTLCNERSSRSHCLIILDVPSVGGRLMLVDMAGSENIEAAGQTGLEAKMQTAKINQGNTALKRVVESIANGDSHVPFRDSKLTMLLQDSFEDDKSKILMILCASPDPKELHKTISTLEYGAKAKCIVRAAHMPTPKGKMNFEEPSVHLNARIAAMNQFIYKLQMENKLKERERDEAQKELLHKEEEAAQLRAKIRQIEGKGVAAKEEEINSKVIERTKTLRLELMKMEEKMLQQQEELNILKRRLHEVEYERSNVSDCALNEDLEAGRFMKKLSEVCAGDQGMVKSMELDFGDQPAIQDVKEIKVDLRQSPSNNWSSCNICMEEGADANFVRFPDKAVLSTVFEDDEEGEERESAEFDYEVDKEVVEENSERFRKNVDWDSDIYLQKQVEPLIDSTATRKTRIQNIFRLCGNHREVAQQVKVQTPTKQRYGDENVQPCTLEVEKLEFRPPNGLISDVKKTDSPVSSLHAPLVLLNMVDKQKSAESELIKRHAFSEKAEDFEENIRNGEGETEGLMDVYVKWEASKECPGNLIKKVKLLKSSSLSDLRKLIEMHFEEEDNKQPFTFLLLGDPTGNPVAKENEAATQVSRLPICNNQLNGHLASLRSAKKAVQRPNHIPFSSLENIGVNTQHPDGLSPKVSQINTNYLTELSI
uniref:Kinesin-like protein KIN-10A n=1 Tax=Ananas comosus var. bracteatus TaxID=296719 RepID=A0A6V7NQJ5_ANACO|nr:unnamed protein product [Ananas comosus var. bracteatus]